MRKLNVFCASLSECVCVSLRLCLFVSKSILFLAVCVRAFVGMCVICRSLSVYLCAFALQFNSVGLLKRNCVCV